MEIDQQFLKEIEVIQEVTGRKVAFDKYQESVKTNSRKSEEEKETNSDKKK